MLVATAITPMAFFETVMAKGHETLVDPETKVDVNTGMIAASRLQAMIDSRAEKTNMADILFKMDLINAIHDTVPQELWPEILRKIVGPVSANTPPDEFEDSDDAEDMDNRVKAAEAELGCWTATQLRGSPVEDRRAPSRTIEPPSVAIRRFTPKTMKDEDDI